GGGGEWRGVVRGGVGVGDGGLPLAHLPGHLLAGGREDAFDVFASAERVGAVVGALAGVVADVEAADGDAVLPAGGGVGDLVVAEDAVAGEVVDAELLAGGALAADVDLLLPQHGSLLGEEERTRAFGTRTRRAAHEVSVPPLRSFVFFCPLY